MATRIETTLHPTRRRKVLTARFDSVAAFGAECSTLRAGTDAHASWWGGDSRSSLLRMCNAGDDRQVAKAEAMLSKINAEIELTRPNWTPSPFGGFADVPAYLSGEPLSMMHLQRPPEESAPVRIFADPTSSAAIDAKDLQNRGAAILALTMAIGTVRPVELWVYTDLDASHSGHSNVMVRINSSPLMVAEACYALANPGFARCLLYGYAEKTMGFQGMWGFGDHCEDATERAEVMRASLQAAPTDLVIPGVSVRDELCKDPVGWVNKQMAKYLSLNDPYGA